MAAPILDRIRAKEMKRHEQATATRLLSWKHNYVAAGAFMVGLLVLLLLPRGYGAHAEPLSVLDEKACPDNCNAKKGWGECLEDSQGAGESLKRCVCSLGRAGPSCGFSLYSIYANNPVYDLEETGQLRKEDLQGWSPEASVYEKYLSQVDAVTVIEVGVWKGLSTTHMAQWLKKQGRGVLIAIDTWLGAPEFWGTKMMENATDERSLAMQHGWPTVYWTFLSNIIHQKLQKVVVPLPQTSQHASVILRRHQITADYIHIDAAHEYGPVKDDIHTWWPLLRYGGILMGDDYATKSGWHGLIKAVREFSLMCELPVEQNGNKFIIRKPDIEWFKAKSHLPAFCHEGDIDHYPVPKGQLKLVDFV